MALGSSTRVAIENAAKDAAHKHSVPTAKIAVLMGRPGDGGVGVQGAVGQQEFTRLVRYAHDRGIRVFETAEGYQTPAMLGEALKGLPRNSYQLMSKVTTFHQGIDPQAKFDELRRISQTEYFDIMLLHWQHTADWPETTTRWQDRLLVAQQSKIIRTHDASGNRLPALRQIAHT